MWWIIILYLNTCNIAYYFLLKKSNIDNRKFDSSTYEPQLPYYYAYISPFIFLFINRFKDFREERFLNYKYQFFNGLNFNDFDKDSKFRKEYEHNLIRSRVLKIKKLKRKNKGIYKIPPFTKLL